MKVMKFKEIFIILSCSQKDWCCFALIQMFASNNQYFLLAVPMIAYDSCHLISVIPPSVQKHLTCIFFRRPGHFYFYSSKNMKRKKDSLTLINGNNYILFNAATILTNAATPN